MPNQGRVIIKCELTREAKRRLDQTREHMGMTNVALTSRLIEWFATQPELI
jgi:hypothetical protein